MGTGGSAQFLRICVGRAALGSGTALAVIGFHPQSHILGHPCFPPQGMGFQDNAEDGFGCRNEAAEEFGCRREKKESENQAGALSRDFAHL